MKCSKCGKELVRGSHLNNHDGLKIAGGIAAFAAFSNPLICTVGLFTAGKKAYDRYAKGEYKIRCPHCNTTINLNKEDYERMINK